jgi:hypothetical protein
MSNDKTPSGESGDVEPVPGKYPGSDARKGVVVGRDADGRLLIAWDDGTQGTVPGKISRGKS